MSCPAIKKRCKRKTIIVYHPKGKKRNIILELLRRQLVKSVLRLTGSNYYEDLQGQLQKPDLKDLQEHLDPKDYQGLWEQSVPLALKDLQEHLGPREQQDLQERLAHLDPKGLQEHLDPKD